MKKILTVILLLTLSIMNLSAGAIVKEFYGKVKVKLSDDSSWSRISVGQELPDEALVSTGFNSQLVLDLGNAILDVLPLTRMKLEKIIEENDTITTSLFLQGGKIKADVERIEGKVNDFKIKSPVATASVRGTSFEFSGNTLKVIEGLVQFGAPEPEAKASEPGKETEDKKEEPGDGKSQPEEGKAQPEEGKDKPEEGTPQPEKPAPTPQAQPAKTVAVQAGGTSQMVSPKVKPVNPVVMAKKGTSVVVSTKPEVVKKVIVETIKGTSPPPEQPKPGAVLEKIETGKTKIRIQIKGGE